MSLLFKIHTEDPQPRLLSQAAAIIRGGGVVIYPTDSCYALGCHIGDKGAMEAIRRIRRLRSDHNLTLVCRDLSEIATYAKVDSAAYRLMKTYTPGPYTFILRATHEVPRRLQNPRRKTIGIRVPDHPITLALLEVLGEPLMSTTLILPGEDLPMVDPELIHERMRNQVKLVIDGGHGGIEPTTVVDMVAGIPVITRRGKGDASTFEG